MTIQLYQQVLSYEFFNIKKSATKLNLFISQWQGSQLIILITFHKINVRRKYCNEVFFNSNYYFNFISRNKVRYSTTQNVLECSRKRSCEKSFTYHLVNSTVLETNQACFWHCFASRLYKLVRHCYSGLPQPEFCYLATRHLAASLYQEGIILVVFQSKIGLKNAVFNIHNY